MDQMEIENRSFSQLFADYQGRFVRFANGYVRDWAIAEDIASDAIIYYWENKSRLPDDTHVPAYIFTTIRNKCLNHLQHLRVKENAFARILTNAQWDLEMRVATLEALEPTELYTKEIQEIVNKALLKLPEKTRDIFRHSRFDDLSNREIAEKMNISVKTVEAHITNAFKILRSELGDYFHVKQSKGLHAF
jgi:RNA polymerase sigma-70 factor (ECF subfamily)